MAMLGLYVPNDDQVDVLGPIGQLLDRITAGRGRGGPTGSHGKRLTRGFTDPACLEPDVDAEDPWDSSEATAAPLRWPRHRRDRLEPDLDVLGNLTTKFMRTYTMQVDALTRKRRKGQQNITVKHVHVYAGGQAIVGAVSHRGGRGYRKK
jgi:hypothetical protein